MMTNNIIISPFSQKMRNDKKNPKDYPYWKEVIKELQNKNLNIIQIGVAGEENLGANQFIINQPLDQLEILVKSAITWCSVDNFCPHFCYLIKKPGVVIYGKSDPIIFGYKENINLLKDRKYLRANQFDIWETETFDENVFVPLETVVEAVLFFLK